MLLEALLAGLKDGGCSVLMPRAAAPDRFIPIGKEKLGGKSACLKAGAGIPAGKAGVASSAPQGQVSPLFLGLPAPGDPFPPNPDGAASPTQQHTPAPLTLPCQGCTGLAEPSCTPAPPKPQGKTQTNPGMTRASPNPAVLHAPAPRGSTKLRRSIPIPIKNLFPSPPTGL